MTQSPSSLPKIVWALPGVVIRPNAQACVLLPPGAPTLLRPTNAIFYTQTFVKETFTDGRALSSLEGDIWQMCPFPPLHIIACPGVGFFSLDNRRLFVAKNAHAHGNAKYVRAS